MKPKALPARYEPTRPVCDEPLQQQQLTRSVASRTGQDCGGVHDGAGGLSTFFFWLRYFVMQYIIEDD
jgi:hypothetical protein